jgi:hypothetical protein
METPTGQHNQGDQHERTNERSHQCNLRPTERSPNFSLVSRFRRFPSQRTIHQGSPKGNYATWPKLTVTLINKYMPDSDDTLKGHLKGQRQGIRSTKHNAFTALVETEETRIKIEGENSPFKPLPPTKLDDIFIHVVDLTKEIHTNQTGAFPHTSQRGNRYIMVAIHLDANYIFAEPMRNRTEGEMIRVYQKIINRMKAAGLGIKNMYSTMNAQRQ